LKKCSDRIGYRPFRRWKAACIRAVSIVGGTSRERTQGTIPRYARLTPLPARIRNAWVSRRSIVPFGESVLRLVMSMYTARSGYTG
jgi:hypothetical protein